MKLPILSAGNGMGEGIEKDGAKGDLLRQLNAWRDKLNAIKFPPLVAIGGVLLSDIAVQSGDNTINHGLRRSVQGWVILRVQAAAAVSLSESSSNDKNLILNSSGSARIAVWVY